MTAFISLSHRQLAAAIAYALFVLALMAVATQPTHRPTRSKLPVSAARAALLPKAPPQANPGPGYAQNN